MLRVGDLGSERAHGFMVCGIPRPICWESQPRLCGLYLRGRAGRNFGCSFQLADLTEREYAYGKARDS